MNKLRTFLSNLSHLARSDISTYSSSSFVGGAARGGDISSALNVPGSQTPAESTILAFACITARREAIGGAPMMITDADGNPIERGPLVELFRQPTTEMNWSQYVRVLETYLTLYNVCAIHPVSENERGPIDALEILHPAGLRAEYGVYQPSGTPRIIRWQYSDPTTGQQRQFEAGQIIVHRGFNPHAPMQALSPMNVLRRTILADICAREQNLGLFLNDATPRGYLHSDQPMTSEQADEVLMKWNSAQKGYLNSHKTAATWGGLKYDRIQLSPAELEFLESLKGLRIDYYMAFRVYPAMLAEMTGETGLSQGSSTGEQRVAWWEDVGLPELDLIAQLHQPIIDRAGVRSQEQGVRTLSRMERWTLSRSLARRQEAGGRLTMWFNDSAIPALARNRTTKVDAAVKLATTIGYLPDDVNEYLNLGLPPHPDNLGRVPFSMQTIGGEGSKEQGARSAEQGADVTARMDRIEELIRADVMKKEALRQGSGQAGQKKFEAFIAPLERAAAERWSRFFVEQRGRVLKRVNSMIVRSDAIVREDPTAFEAMLFPRREEDASLLARLTPLWSEQLREGWDYLHREVGMDAQQNPFQIEDPRIQEAIKARKMQGLMVNETTGEDLRRILAESTANGDTMPQLADRFAAYYRDNGVGPDKVRPLTAAKTQTAGIVNDGRLAAARDAGGLKKYWRHGGSENPRQTHLAAARDYNQSAAIPLEQKFRVGGEDMDAPGDANASISNVANCSCSLGFVRSQESGVRSQVTE